MISGKKSAKQNIRCKSFLVSHDLSYQKASNFLTSSDMGISILELSIEDGSLIYKFLRTNVFFFKNPARNTDFSIFDSESGPKPGPDRPGPKKPGTVPSPGTKFVGTINH